MWSRMGLGRVAHRQSWRRRAGGRGGTPYLDFAHRLIDAFISGGACEFMEACARPLPSLAFFDLAIHAPAEDLERVAHLASRSSTPNATDARECWLGLYGWIKEFIAQRRRRPPPRRPGRRGRNPAARGKPTPPRRAPP